MSIFADCSTNVAEITAAQFCQGFGGCGADGLLATAGNLNAVLKAITESSTFTSTTYDATSNILTITFADGSTFGINLTQALADAVADSTVPSGNIMMRADSTVPTGWVICDGTNGTPDLRDRFIVAAGSTYGVGTTGGAATHTHTATVDSATTGANLSTTPDNVDSSGGTPVVGAVTLNDPGHSHTASVAAGANIPPYYSLIFIMKL